MSEWDDSADEKNGVLEFLDVVSVSWTYELIKIYENFQCAIVLSVPIYKQLCDLKHLKFLCGLNVKSILYESLKAFT